MIIANHQTLNLIKWIDNSFLNYICSFNVIPYISLFSWFGMQSVSVILQVVASVSASDGRTWNSTRSSAVMFTAPWISPSAAVFICAICLANVLLRPVALFLTSWNSCRLWCWKNSSKSMHLTDVIWWISHSSHSIALSRSTSDHLVATCWALVRRTWNCLRFNVVTFSATYTWTSIAAHSLWILCSRKWWDLLANIIFTLAFADFNIFWSQKASFCLLNRISTLSSAVRNWSEWFCWLTSRENSPNARSVPITIFSEAVTVGVLPSSYEQSGIGTQLTDSVLNMRRICLPYQELLFIESNDLEKRWRPRYRGTDVNRLSNWSLTFLAFWYLSSQCNKSLTRPKSNWCISSGCQSW